MGYVYLFWPYWVGAEEKFKPCTYPGVFPGLYYIGCNGTVINNMKNFVVSQRLGSGGYPQLHLMTIDRGSRDFMTHRLVAWEWVLENRDLSLDVNHKNGNKTDNYFLNLEWKTHLENVRHAFNQGLVGDCKGIHHRHKLSEEEVRQICELLQDPNMMYKEVIQRLGLDVTVGSIQSIADGSNWSHITKDYNIPPRNRSKPKK